MRKLLVALISLILFSFAGCTTKETELTYDEKVAKQYVENLGYGVTLRKGQIDKYVLERSKLNGSTESIQYQQQWGVQAMEPEKYFGKEISIYCFIVRNHPLEKIYNVKTNIYIMLTDSKVIGGYSFPDGEQVGSVYSLVGKDLEGVTGLSYKKMEE